MTAFCEEVYPTPFLKAAAIAEAIACGHPFNDGNHRTALAAAHVVLGLFDLMLIATALEQREAILNLGNKQAGLEQFSAWLEQKCVLRSRPN
jgi:death-on-curing protein